MTDTIQTLATDAPAILRDQVRHIGHLVAWSRKQTLNPTLRDDDFADAYAEAGFAVAQIEELARRFEDAMTDPRPAVHDAKPHTGPDTAAIIREQGEPLSDLLNLVAGLLLEGARKLTAADEEKFQRAGRAHTRLMDLAHEIDQGASRAAPTGANQADNGAPDYDALRRVNPLIESDLPETIDNVTDALELLSGIFVWSDAVSLMSSEERQAGIAHQLDGCIAALNFVGMEVQRQQGERTATGAA